LCIIVYRVTTSLGFQIFNENDTKRIDKQVGIGSKKFPLLSVRPDSVKQPTAQPDKENCISVNNVPPVALPSTVDSQKTAEPVAALAHLAVSSNVVTEDIEMKDENADWVSYA